MSDTSRNQQFRRHGGGSLRYNAPLSRVRAARLARAVASTRPGLVLDVGCGSGALLHDVLLAAPTARGRGVDVDPVATARADRAARALGLADRVTHDPVDAGQSTLRADAVLCVGSSHAVGGLEGLLHDVDADTMLVGEGFWYGSQPLAWRDVFGPLPEGLGGLIDRSHVAGWTVIDAEASDPWEWDAFERAWGDGVRRSHLPGAAVFADARWDAYARGYRGRLGFGWLLLQR